MADLVQDGQVVAGGRIGAGIGTGLYRSIV
jgi:hypothetical protein